MSDDRTRRLAQLRQAYESGILDEDTYRAAVAALGVEAEIQAIVEGPGAVARDGSVAAAEGAVGVGRDVGGHVVIAEKGATVVIGEAPVAMTAVDRESALGRYLHHVISRNRYLQLQGIRSGGRLVHIELDRIYVALRATRQRMVQVEEALPGWGEIHRLRQRVAGATETVLAGVDEVLDTYSRLVVLGDPGSGRTTLSRYLALLYARDLAEGTALVQEKLGLDERGRLPILLLARQIGAFLCAHRPVDDGTEGHAVLLEFIFRSLENERIQLPADFFDESLTQGQAVILVDGLDEVADPDLRRRISRLVEAFTQAYADCRYIVASRAVGYTGPVRLGAGYETTTVQDFSMADVERFLANWHWLVAISQMGQGENIEVYAKIQTRQLLEAIRASSRIRELAANPLLLTVIAMVHHDRVRLPDRRAELYSEALDVLLGKWEEAKGVKEVPILVGKPFGSGDKRMTLQNLALRMHEKKLTQIAAEDLHRWLDETFAEIVRPPQEPGHATNRFLQVMEERTGLLIQREGVYAFSHLSFQEYLTALAVAAQDDYVAYTLARAPDPWWREVILLEAGYLSTQSDERTTRLIQAIAELRDEPEPYHNLVLAAECLRDVGSSRVHGSLVTEVQQRLLQMLEARPPIWLRWMDRPGVARAWLKRRSVAMEALVRIGAGYWTHPHGEPEWIQVPAGEFRLGEGTQGHRINLEAFCVSRAPVTNAQYHLFVQATGYPAPEGWEDERPPKGRESHPVVNVSWHHAMAYCQWLSHVTRKPITLPSEAEWEKAARGAKKYRRYPWGDVFDWTQCNSSRLELEDTTPVGIFPGGASPYGVLDMAGNVWEWTRSVYRHYPYGPTDGREDLRAEGARVLRGGSFRSSDVEVCCTYRYSSNPGSRHRTYGFRIIVTSSVSSDL
jgi:formylglycine-generating enzyme required for sulfatase activity